MRRLLRKSRRYRRLSLLTKLDLARATFTEEGQTTLVRVPFKSGLHYPLLAKNSLQRYRRALEREFAGISHTPVKISPLLVEISNTGQREAFQNTALIRAIYRTDKRSRRPSSPPLKIHNPALRKAYNSIFVRFGKMEWIQGIGVGRKYSERSKAYSEPTLHEKHVTGGKSVKIYIHEKLKDELLAPSKRLPKWIYVKRSRSKKRVKVPVDVMTVGRSSLSEASTTAITMTPQSGSGFFAPGYRFGCGLDGANSPSGPVNPPRFSNGTCGVLIRYKTGSYFGTSAAHQFLQTCAGEYKVPIFARQLVGSGGQVWLRVPGIDFLPQDIESKSPLIRDAMVFIIPDGAELGQNPWPGNFLYRFATDSETNKATSHDGIDGFIWVERNNTRQEIPVDLHAGVNDFSASVDCGGNGVTFNYGFVWHLIMSGSTTVRGDSGAPVFLRLDTGECSLLGFHFLHTGKDRYAYAVDAQSFLQTILGGLGSDFTFVR
jgi:hypothetical protein